MIPSQNGERYRDLFLDHGVDDYAHARRSTRPGFGVGSARGPSGRRLRRSSEVSWDPVARDHRIKMVTLPSPGVSLISLSSRIFCPTQERCLHMRIMSYAFSRYFPLFWHPSALSLALHPFEILPYRLSASTRVPVDIMISCQARRNGPLGGCLSPGEVCGSDVGRKG